LRERNRNYLEFQVSDDNKAIMLLESQFGISDYEVHAEGNIRVYSHLGKQGRLNKAFVENGIEVLKINISEEGLRSEEHTSELQSRFDLVCRLLLENK